MVRCNRIVLVAVLSLVATLLGTACSDSGPDPGPTDPEALVRAALLEEASFAFEADSTVNSDDSDFGELFPTPNPEATPFPIELPDELIEHCPGITNPGEPRNPPEGVITAYSRMFNSTTAGPPSTGAAPRVAFVSLAVNVYETEQAAEEAFDASLEELESGDHLGTSEECLDALASYLESQGVERPMFVQREREPEFSIPGVRLWQTRMTTSNSEQFTSSVNTFATFTHDYVVATYTANESVDGSINHEALIRAFVDQVVEADNRR